MKISKELQIGAIAVVAIGMFIWGFNYISGKNLFNKPARTYYTEYENVQGLNTASEVTINGVKVGRVETIDFIEEVSKRGWLKVTFSVDNPLKFSSKSIVKIYSASLMGGKSLAIVPSFDGEPAESGIFLKGEIESDILSSMSEKLNPLQAKFESVVVSIDSLVYGLNNLLDDESRSHIKKSIKNLGTTLTFIKNASSTLDTLMLEGAPKIRRIIDKTDKAIDNFTAVSKSLKESNLEETFQNLNSLSKDLKVLSGKIKNGDGTLGKLVNNDSLYINLERASKELEELLKDLKLNPKRYVHFSLFGKKNKEYQPHNEDK